MKNMLSEQSQKRKALFALEAVRCLVHVQARQPTLRYTLTCE